MNVFAALIEPPKFAMPPKMTTPKTFIVRRKGPRLYDNPWQLTDAERDAICAIVEVGCGLGAADLLGISHRTMERHERNVRKKMKVGNRVLAALAWDRWTRAQA